MESHPDTVISDDLGINNSALTLTWKENKEIKVSLNTTHGCTTLYLTGLFASGFISSKVWEKSGEKRPNLQPAAFAQSLVSQRGVKTKLNTVRSNRSITRCFPPLSPFFRSLAASKTLIWRYYLPLQTQPITGTPLGSPQRLFWFFFFSFVCFSIFSASDAHKHTMPCKQNHLITRCIGMQDNWTFLCSLVHLWEMKT